MINPDVINPPLGPQQVKNCDTCAHEDRLSHEQPCVCCGTPDKDDYSNWEPVVMQKPGPKYKTGGLVPDATVPHAGVTKAAPIDSDSKAAADFIRNTTVITAPDILSAAEKHTRDRAATYDKPEGERSMAQTVKVFNAFHGTSITEAQGWHFMQVLKDVRLFTNKGYHADSAEDGVAYAGLKAEAKAKE